MRRVHVARTAPTRMHVADSRKIDRVWFAAGVVRVQPAAVNRISEEEQGLFCSTEQICISPPLDSDEMMTSSREPLY